MNERSWESYRGSLWVDDDLGIRLDVSRMGLGDRMQSGLAGPLKAAFEAMAALEAGAVSNPDENRQVGHYWLRDPDLAPDPEISEDICETLNRIADFVRGVQSGEVAPEKADRFRQFLLIGIGGSALGPQFLCHSLGGHGLEGFFLDNTDPDGFDRILGRLDNRLNATLVLVVSKSGGTRETRNGMLEVQAAFERAGLGFGAHAVAVTGRGSALDQYARDQGFLDVFPMWDWVGGRTSVFSAVGLLPAALAGIDIGGLLTGARKMDERTRVAIGERNPAALLAAAWHTAGNGKGERDMVVLPYRDRLILFSRYLQQLVMESLGKEKDREGTTVDQGLVVYGNKGSTDQHAFVQQLRDGTDNFFVTFIEVLKDRSGESIEVEPGVTSGDYLMGFLIGTRKALADKGRRSLTLTLNQITAETIGMLIALYERAVGLYAELIDVNAYHQPGVEAGKRAAAEVLDLQGRALALLAESGRPWGVLELARDLSAEDETETLFMILEHASANPDHGVTKHPGQGPDEHRYSAG